MHSKIIKDMEKELTFGKFKGKTLEEIPSSYLKWMSENLDGNYDSLANSAHRVWQWREKYDEHI